MTDKQKKLFKLLTAIPPKLEETEGLLKSGTYSKEDLAVAAVEYGWACFCEVRDTQAEKGVKFGPGIVPGLNSTYIYPVMELLLRYGLDPNYAVDEENAMSMLEYMDNELLAADTMALFLEHGGDMHRYLSGETLWGAVDFNFFYTAEACDPGQRALESHAHVWMVMVGYGASHKDAERIKPVPGFDLAKLKNHRNYDFCLTWRGKYHAELHIFDRESRFEVVVAR